MTGGVVRRDGLREEIARVLNEEGCRPGSSIHSWRCEYPDSYGGGPCDCVEQVADQIIARVLDAVPDVPPTEATHCANCGQPVRSNEPHKVGECQLDTSDVPPTEAGLSVDELGRVLNAAVEHGRAEADVPPDPPAEHKHLSCETCRFNMAKAYREGADSVAAADVRASALEDALERTEDVLEQIEAEAKRREGSNFYGDENWLGWAGAADLIRDEIARLRTDRAVSEREGAS